MRHAHQSLSNNDVNQSISDLTGVRHSIDQITVNAGQKSLLAETLLNQYNTQMQNFINHSINKNIASRSDDIRKQLEEELLSDTRIIERVQAAIK